MERAARSAEIAIIGAGIIGLSVAYHLARSGHRGITVLDAVGIGAGASGIAPGGVRRQWSTPESCAMSSESLAFYRQVNEYLQPESPLVFRECGYAFLAHSDLALAELRQGVELQNRFDIPSCILSPDELHNLVSALRVHTVVGAAYCGEDGYFDDPWGVVYAFARAARGLGVSIETAQVTEIASNGSSWELRLQSGGAIGADQVVVACGTDTPALLRSLDVDVPIEVEPRYLFFSNPVEERWCDPLIISSERQFALKQLADGQFLTSYLGAGRQDREQTPEAWRARIAEIAEELFPSLLDLQLTHMVKGYYDMTPDHQPVVGRVPNAEGIWVAAGMSGHGFMMAPAVGRAMANLIDGREPSRCFLSLGMDRFSREHLLAEARVI